MIIERFSKAGRQVWLTTNGIRIPESLFSSIINNARGVLLSLVGSDTKSYLQTARYDGFEKAMNTLGNLSIAKNQSQSSIELNVTHVFNEPSIDGLENLVLRLDDLGVNEFRLRYDLFSSPSDLKNVRGREKIHEILSKFPNLRTKIVLKSPPNETLPRDYNCNSPFIWPNWNPLHGVFPCAHITEEQNRIPSRLTNGVYSLVDIQADPQSVIKQDCHRRCPSRIHWFNLFLNGYNFGNEGPDLSIKVK